MVSPFHAAGVEGLRHGDRGSAAIVFHGGTPQAALLLPDLVAAGDRLGMQLVTWSRPGYAGSERRPNRSVADNAAITEAVADAVDAPWLVSVGWSGGGPHALADVALVERCRAGATIAGAAPFDAEIDWLDGMAPDNVAEYGAAASDPDGLRTFLTEVADALANVEGASVAESLGELVSEVDRAALTGEFAEQMAESIRGAVTTGIEGWYDDDLAFVKPWGFDIAGLTKPVAVWQGGEDRMVPFAHGEWLARTIPTAVAHLLREEGHITLGVRRIGDIVDSAVALANA